MSKVKKIVLPWVLALVLVVGSCMPVMATSQRYYFDTEYMAQLANEYCGKNRYTDFAVYCYYIKGDVVRILASTDNFKKGNYNDGSFMLNGFVNDDSVCSFEYNIASDVLSCTYVSTNWILDYSTVDAGNFYSTSNIYDREGNLFFQPTLPRLYQIAAGISAEAVLREILTMTPLLVPLLAGYLGLRKALNFLSTILKTA